MSGEHNLTQRRFAALAEAYGADFDRWPSAERAAAEALLGSREAEAILAREGRLDALLDSYRVSSARSALVGRILACAPQSALLGSRTTLWWSALGFAGIGLAGAATGALALSLATPRLLEHRSTDWAEGQTIFGAVDLGGITA
jgi:hypothetical protein